MVFLEQRTFCWSTHVVIKHIWKNDMYNLKVLEAIDMMLLILIPCMPHALISRILEETRANTNLSSLWYPMTFLGCIIDPFVIELRLSLN